MAQPQRLVPARRAAPTRLLPTFQRRATARAARQELIAQETADRIRHLALQAGVPSPRLPG